MKVWILTCEYCDDGNMSQHFIEAFASKPTEEKLREYIMVTNDSMQKLLSEGSTWFHGCEISFNLFEREVV